MPLIMFNSLFFSKIKLNVTPPLKIDNLYLKMHILISETQTAGIGFILFISYKLALSLFKLEDR